ncbi:hypothetical protein ACFUIT_21520 [Streptomyces sp. NPDC057239]|uniref:hypothetical protein n=1 Tax=Streptomyces sp. NPDC057239 TaxID=3346061 RepID=UPI003645B99C
MTQQAKRRPGPLRALGLVAAASLVAAGAAGTARAADEPLPVTITGEDRVDLSLGSGNGDSTEPQVDLRLNVPGEEFEGEGDVPTVFTGDYTIRIDATELEGVASVDLPCDVDGLVATCTGWELYAGQQYNRVGTIRLDLDDDSEAGDFGSIKVTGEGEGLDFTPLNIDVLVGGPEFVNHKLSLPEDYQAGETYKAPLGLRNVGNMPAEGAVLRFHGSRGVSFPDSFGNCAYSEVTTGPLLYQGTDVICTFPDTIEAGAAYALAEPLKVGTADFALRDIFTYSFTAVPPSEAAGLRAAKDYRQGNGADLELKQVSGADPADYSRYAELDLPTTNTYDLELTGASLDAEAGDTVTAEIGFRNNGPAWISALRSGGESFSFTVEIPEGATVAKAPQRCREITLAEGGKGYRCMVSTPLLEDAEFTYPFELRVDRVVENARGEVALPESNDPAESNLVNNSAWIVLNGPDEQTDGGTGQNGGGATPSASPSPSSSSGSGQDGGAGSSGSGTSGSVQGGLASTGAGGAALIGGAALLALGLGAGVTVLLRRRARQTGGAIA